MKDPGTGGAWGSGHVGPDCEQQVAAPGEIQRINLRSRGRETSRKEATPKKNGEPSNTEGWLLTYPLPALKVEPPFLHSSSKRKGIPPPIQAQPFSWPTHTQHQSFLLSYQAFLYNVFEVHLHCRCKHSIASPKERGKEKRKVKRGCQKMEKRIAYNKLYHCINVLYSYSYDAITEKDTLRDQR